MTPKGPLNRSTLSQQVYLSLRQQILRGQLKQGQRLSEQAIAQELGVSPTPVREALRLLDGGGLVNVNDRRGARVINPSPYEIHQCFAVRTILERFAIREAMALFSAEDKAVLYDLAHTVVATGPRARESFFETDSSFHGSIIAKANNAWVKSFLSSLNDFLLVVRAPLVAAKGANVKQMRREHIAVALAVKAGQVEEAERRIEAHISRVCNDILSSMRSARDDTDENGDGVVDDDDA